MSSAWRWLARQNESKGDPQCAMNTPLQERERDPLVVEFPACPAPATVMKLIECRRQSDLRLTSQAARRKFGSERMSCAALPQAVNRPNLLSRLPFIAGGFFARRIDIAIDWGCDAWLSSSRVFCHLSTAPAGLALHGDSRRQAESMSENEIRILAENLR